MLVQPQVLPHHGCTLLLLTGTVHMYKRLRLLTDQPERKNGDLNMLGKPKITRDKSLR